MKFKVWDKEKKKFVELEGGYYIHSSGKLCYFGNAGMDFADKRYSVVFSTGKTDKNGVELFGGDVANNSYGSMVCIYFDKEMNTWMIYNPKEKSYDRLSDDAHTLQKIGSKLEDPELLK